MENKVFREGIETNRSKKNSALEFLYNTTVGRIVLKLAVSPCISKSVGKFLDSRLSARLIDGFIKKKDIDMSMCEKDSFKSFNDFFTRRLKQEARPFDSNPNKLCSPCDSKLLVYKINEDSTFDIKNSTYTIAELLRSKKLAEKYNNGWCFVYRLEPTDYHRYAYIDNGVKTRNFYIKGVFHTVQPIAMNAYPVFKRNSREFTMLKTENFGDVIQIEVGAMLVGKITNFHDKHRYVRGEEKGMFEFGGSTIVQLFTEGTVYPDSDIIINSINSQETQIKMGEVIASRQ